MPPLSTTLLTAVKLAVQNPLTPSCKTDGICLWWEKVCWEKASQMLPKGHQTSLFLRDTWTALITNRPRSSFFVGTGVSFASLTTNNEKNPPWFWHSVHLVLGIPASVTSWNLEIRCFCLYCGRNEKEQTKGGNAGHQADCAALQGHCLSLKGGWRMVDCMAQTSLKTNREILAGKRFMKHKQVLLQSQFWYGSVLCVCASSGQDQLTPDEGRKRNALLTLLLKFLISRQLRAGS